MGEISEAMIEGSLCEGCGVWLGQGDGYPRRCAACEEESELEETKLEPCPFCKKKFFKKEGVRDHIRGKHIKEVNKLIERYINDKLES